MACFHPIKGYQLLTGGPLFFRKPLGVFHREQMVPCGQCVGCRLERSRQWALRCEHEASRHSENCFLTLTYRDEAIPQGWSLNKKHFQDFMKRLRKHLNGVKVRYFHCGEYGEKFGRPHYHCLLFGVDFPDKVFYKTTKTGHKLYISATLDRLWSHGHCQIGSFTFESAAYCARYVMKKITGRNAAQYYEAFDGDGVVHQRIPEYCTMSRRPGIGRDWLDTFQSDVYPRDFVISRGVRCNPPRYYNSVYEVAFPSDYRRLKAKRRERLAKHVDNNTPDRLKVREYIAKKKLGRFSRDVE